MDPTQVAARSVVPASTSNLGPGFDLFGLAVDIYLRLRVEVEGTFVMSGMAAPEVTMRWEGEGSGAPDPVPTDEENLAVRGILRAWRESGVSLDGKLRIEAKSEIPVARGLGSSAAAYLAGLLAGDAVASSGIEQDRFLELTAAEEGHPDNAAPCLYGGLVAAAPVVGSEGVRTHRARLYEDYLLGAVVPDLTVSTRIAREALPARIDHAEAVRSQQRAFFLFQALTEGWTEALRELVTDVLHQPYRAPLVPGFDDLVALAYAEGAAAAWLSGSGPTILVLSDGGADAVEGITAALQRRWEADSIGSRTLLLGPDDVGAAAHVLT